MEDHRPHSLRRVWEGIKIASCVRVDAAGHGSQVQQTEQQASGVVRRMILGDVKVAWGEGGDNTGAVKPTTVMSRRTGPTSTAAIKKEDAGSGANEREPSADQPAHQPAPEMCGASYRHILPAMPRSAQRFLTAAGTRGAVVYAKAEPLLSLLRFLLRFVVGSKWFSALVNALVLTNVCVMAFRTFPAETSTAKSISEIDTAFSIFFFIEMLLKIAAWGFKTYAQNSWNILDGVIASLTILAIIVEALAHVPLPAITVLRAIRILRIVRLVRGAETLKTYLFALSLAAPAVVNVIVVMVLFFLVYTSLGVPLFYNVRWGDEFVGDIDSVSNFQGFSNSFVSLFVVSTGEGWVQVMQSTFFNDAAYSCQLDVNLDGSFADETGCGNKILGALFFTSFYLIHHYVLVSLLTVIVIDSYTAAYGSRARASSSKAFIRAFAAAWQAHDPDFTGYVRIIHLRDIMLDSRVLGEQATLRDYARLAKVAAKYLHVEYRMPDGEFSTQSCVRYISLESTFYALSRVSSPGANLPPSALLVDALRATYKSPQGSKPAHVRYNREDVGPSDSDNKTEKKHEQQHQHKGADHHDSHGGGEGRQEARREKLSYTDKDEWDWDQVENYAARVIQFAMVVYSEHARLKVRLLEDEYEERICKRATLWRILTASELVSSQDDTRQEDAGDREDKSSSIKGSQESTAHDGARSDSAHSSKEARESGQQQENAIPTPMTLTDVFVARTLRLLRYVHLKWRQSRGKGAYAFAGSEYVGSMTVKLLEAKNLPETLRAGKCDPFVTMWCGGLSHDKGFYRLEDASAPNLKQVTYNKHNNMNVDSNSGRVDKSHVVLDTYDPVWNEIFAFDIRCETDKLNVQVYDDDVIANRPVGECVIPVTTTMLAPNMECEQWFALSRGARQEGNVRLLMKAELFKWVIDVGIVECRGLPQQYISEKECMNAYCVAILGHHALATTPRSDTFDPVFKEKLRFYVADPSDELRLVMVNNQPQKETGDTFVSQTKVALRSILSEHNIGMDAVTGKRKPGTWDLSVWLPLTTADGMRPWGQLNVTVVEARGLPKMDAFGKVDPYCVVRMMTPGGPLDARGLNTPVKLTTFTPRWESEFTFDVMTSDDKLRVEVYDHDWSGVSSLIGVIHVPLAPFMGRLEPFDAWYEIQPGEIPSEDLIGLDGSLGQVRLILDLATQNVDYTGSFGYIHVSIHAQVLAAVPTLRDLGESWTAVDT
jgi:hypothetical protein